MKTYSEIPEAPEGLEGDIGKQHWKIYCEALLDRGELTEQHLAGVESLAFLEQQRVNVQKTINESGLTNTYDTKNGEVTQSNGLDKTLRGIVNSLRYLKTDMNLHPTGESKDSSPLKLANRNY